MVESVKVRAVGLIDVLHLGDWRRERGCDWIFLFPLSEIGFKLCKGLSTAEGGRGHVTTYMYCVTIKIQTLGPDIL